MFMKKIPGSFQKQRLKDGAGLHGLRLHLPTQDQGFARRVHVHLGRQLGALRKGAERAPMADLWSPEMSRKMSRNVVFIVFFPQVHRRFYQGCLLLPFLLPLPAAGIAIASFRSQHLALAAEVRQCPCQKECQNRCQIEPDRMSEYMPERMLDRMSECVYIYILLPDGISETMSE